MIKYHIPAINTPQRVEVPKGSSIFVDAPQRHKRREPIDAKDKNPQKTKYNKETMSLLEPLEEDCLEDENPSTFAHAPNNHNVGIAEQPDQNILGNDEDLVDVNIEVSMNLVNIGEAYNRNITVVDDIFASTIDLTISNDNLDLEPKLEPKSIAECRKRLDWVRWKQAIEAELDSLNKRNFFVFIVRTPQNVIPIGYKWVFVRKRSENNEAVRYKARLVAQGFS